MNPETKDHRRIRNLFSGYEFGFILFLNYRNIFTGFRPESFLRWINTTTFPAIRFRPTGGGAKCARALFRVL